MFVDWTTPRISTRQTSGKRPVRKETRYRVVCDCGAARWLKRADAQKAETRQALCSTCSRHANGVAAYNRLVQQHGRDYAKRMGRAWRLAQPSAGERAIMTMLDQRGIRYEREVEVATRLGSCFIDFEIDFGGDRRVLVEFNGGVHALPHVQERDAIRQAALLTVGVAVLVVTDHDLPVFPIILREVQHGIRPVA